MRPPMMMKNNEKSSEPEAREMVKLYDTTKNASEPKGEGAVDCNVDDIDGNVDNVNRFNDGGHSVHFC